MKINNQSMERSRNTYRLLAEGAFKGENATIDGLTEVLGLAISHGKVDLDFDGLLFATR